MIERTKPDDSQIVKKKKKKKLIIIILLVIVVIVIALIGYAYFTKSLFLKLENEDEKKIEEQIFELNEFILNLNDENSRRYLKTKIVLTYEDKKDIEKFKNNVSQIRDTIIETLREKTSEDMMNVNNLDALKNEIKDKTNQLFDVEIVLEVYFVDFLIQ